MGAEESPMIVSATPQTVSELDTPAAVSVVSGDDMRQATPRINLSESLGSVPGLQIQNRQNYAQDLQLSMRGFGARSTFGVRGIRMYVDGIPATMPDGQGQTSNIDLSSVDSVEVLRGPSPPFTATPLVA
jgi:iron complex outermembrane receptor protein